MKYLINFTILFLGTTIGSLFLPWWTIAPLALAVAYFSKNSNIANFVLSFVAIFLAWILSIYYIDNGTISNLLGKLFEVKANMMPFISAIMGGLIAGIFGLSGSLLAPNEPILSDADKASE